MAKSVIERQKNGGSGGGRQAARAHSAKQRAATLSARISCLAIIFIKRAAVNACRRTSRMLRAALQRRNRVIRRTSGTEYHLYLYRCDIMASKQ